LQEIGLYYRFGRKDSLEVSEILDLLLVRKVQSEEFYHCKNVKIFRTVWLLGRERGRTSYIEAVVHGHEYRRIGREATHTQRDGPLFDETLTLL